MWRKALFLLKLQRFSVLLNLRSLWMLPVAALPEAARVEIANLLGCSKHFFATDLAAGTLDVHILVISELANLVAFLAKHEYLRSH